MYHILSRGQQSQEVVKKSKNILSLVNGNKACKTWQSNYAVLLSAVVQAGILHPILSIAFHQQSRPMK